MNYPADRPAIAIVGGGFSGTAIAYHLARFVEPGVARITIIEPRSWLGGGLAYSTSDLAHRVNVPAVRMSIDPDDSAHFTNWLSADGILEADPDGVTADGRVFPLRSMFGRYMRETIAPVLSSGRVSHVRARVLQIDRMAGGYGLKLSTSQKLSAGLVVIATSHPPPAPPRLLKEALAGDPSAVRPAAASPPVTNSPRRVSCDSSSSPRISPSKNSSLIDPPFLLSLSTACQ